MEVGRTLVRIWARRPKSTSFQTVWATDSLSDMIPSIVRDDAIGTAQGGGGHSFLVANSWKLGTFSTSFLCITTRNFSSNLGERKKQKKLMPLQERKMIDKIRLRVRGGAGGAGCTSFRKSRHSRHGIADGGQGGKGGDVILVSSAAVWDMSNLHRHLNGTRGGPGTSKKKVGSRGMDKTVQVPIGTVIHLVKGSIPFLEQSSPLQEEPAWEEWDNAHSHEKNNSQLGMPQEFKTESSIGYTSFQDLGIAKCEQEPSIGSLRDSSSVVHYSDPDEDADYTEACGSVEWPHCSISNDGISMPSVSIEEWNSDNDISDVDEEDDIVEQGVQSSIAEFTEVGQSFVVACGGVGGKGNSAMARGRGSERGLPSFEHEEGQRGSEADLILELKTIADVGLVGAPNAGKSTLLGSLSRAKPSVGQYMFTTLRPSIGMVEFEDSFKLTVADIPGLIEGAHENKGLGHAFLRHIERTKVLAYVVDLGSGIGDDTRPLPWDQFDALVFELEQYQKGLSRKSSIVIANKIDEEGALEALEFLRQKVPFLEIYPVCAVLEEGVDALKLGLRKLLESSQTGLPQLSQLREL